MNNENIKEQDELIVDEKLQKKLWIVPVEIDLIRNNELPNGAKIFYQNLLYYARTKTTCFPSIETLSKDLNIGESAINRYKNELKKAGFLTWKKERKRDSYGYLYPHNTYILLNYEPIKPTRLTQSNQHGLHNQTSIDKSTSNNTITSILNTYGQAHKTPKKKHFKKEALPIVAKNILSRFSLEYKKRKGIPYRPNGPSWNVLYNGPIELFEKVIAVDDVLKEKNKKSIWERWFDPTLDDFVAGSDRGLAIMFNDSAFPKFWEDIPFKEI